MKPSKYWDMVVELMELVEDCEIDNEDHEIFIKSLSCNLDPYHPEEELSERQLRWLVWIYNRYLNDNDQDEWED